MKRCALAKYRSQAERHEPRLIEDNCKDDSFLNTYLSSLGDGHENTSNIVEGRPSIHHRLLVDVEDVRPLLPGFLAWVARSWSRKVLKAAHVLGGQVYDAG